MSRSTLTVPTPKHQDRDSWASIIEQANELYRLGASGRANDGSCQIRSQSASPPTGGFWSRFERRPVAPRAGSEIRAGQVEEQDMSQKRRMNTTVKPVDEGVR
ncbi:hypothetical protein MMC13_005595 [Lambiella insularis]|nr:hypothetical protein [Lambiella insularis]